jgi:hypothetical protein
VKIILALSATCVLLIASAVILLTRRNLRSALLAVAVGCFGVVALTHVFEQFSILPQFGWGQPRTVGHFIDLAAALLGAVFSIASLVLRHRGVTPR